MTTNIPRAIIHISTKGADDSRVNYSRRMYAIIRRYTPDVVEGNTNECLADLTGLRTFFKMTYQGIVEKILEDLHREIGIRFRARVAKSEEFQKWADKGAKKSKTVSTYKEINRLFVGKSFVEMSKRTTRLPERHIKRIRLTIPFLGKVR